MAGKIDVSYIISFVILIFAFCFHAFGIYLLCKLRENRTNQRTIILNLSMDEFLCSIVDIIIVILRWSGISYKHEIMTTFNMISNVFYILERLFIVMITLDRFLGAKLGLKYSVQFSKRKAIVILICLWITGLSLLVPLLLLPAGHRNNVFKIVYPTLDGLVVICALVTYIYIAKRLYSKGISEARRASDQENKPVAAPTNKLLKMASLIIASFIICVAIPDTIYLVVVVLLKKRVEVLIEMLPILFQLNLLADAVIYIFLQRRVREQFFRTISFWRKNHKSDEGYNTRNNGTDYQTRSPALISRSRILADTSL